MQSTSSAFQDAIHYLESFIPKTNMNRFPGKYGLVRTKQLLELLGNPQEKVKIIHIAGTSGKGSTAMVMNALLQSQGFKVGLHVKPHLLDIRERFQINSKLLREEKVLGYLEVVKAAISKIDSSSFGAPTYFEVVMSLAYSVFAEEKVDYAVVETGVGGEFDGSNTIINPSKLVLISKIGFDHMAILGETLPEIAHHKAMIMQPGTVGFTVPQLPEVETEFTRVASAQQARLETILPPTGIEVTNNYTQFDFHSTVLELPALKLGLIGDYQAENASLALAGFLSLSIRDHFSPDEGTIRAALEHLSYPGRFETLFYQGKKLILDGAHNTQKMAAFLGNLKALYPHKKFSFVVGFKEGKEIEAMVQQIIPLASRVITTGFFNETVDFVAISEEPEQVACVFRAHGFTHVIAIPSVKSVVEELPGTGNEIFVVTGSLYMISDFYPYLNTHDHRNSE